MFENVTTPDLARRLNLSTHEAGADTLRTRQTLKEAASRLVILHSRVEELTATVSTQTGIIQEQRDRLENSPSSVKVPAKSR